MVRGVRSNHPDTGEAESCGACSKIGNEGLGIAHAALYLTRGRGSHPGDRPDRTVDGTSDPTGDCSFASSSIPHTTVDLLSVDPLRPDPARIAEAAERLRSGGLVAFPTETVYGLGADATSAAAIAGIYEAKGRPATNPLIVHAPDPEAARALARVWPNEAQRLAEEFWPGPLTLVLPRAPGLADEGSAGLDTVGIRVPAHPVATALLEATGGPVAAPSANRSTTLSPTTAEHVAMGLATAQGLVLDGGPTPVGIESTVISLAGNPTLLRPGAVTAREIEEIVGPLRRPDRPDHAPGDAAPSPGLMHRHYAPSARLVVFTDPDQARAGIRRSALEGRPTGALLRDPLDAPIDHALPMPADPREYARLLYAALHALDRAGAREIWIEAAPDGEAWDAVRDRLRRASAS